MGIEAATYISDLQAANPGSADLRSQGDDHMRLIKQVLQNTFPSASKAFYFPSAPATKTADFSILASDQNKIFAVDTTAGIVNATLPTLSAGDAGWEVTLIKIVNSANPMLVKVAGGAGFASGPYSVFAARRCIPFVRISCFWTGGFFAVSRSVSAPVGSALEFHAAALPVGYEWPNGQVLASAAANYPEYNLVMGSGATLDKRGRLGIPLDNLGGSSAGRLGGGVITGTTIGNTGGTDVVTLGLAQTPTGITSSNGAVSITVNSTQGVLKNATDSAVTGSGFSFGFSSVQSPATLTSTGTNSISVTSNNTSGGSHSNLQPSIMVGQVLVVE